MIELLTANTPNGKKISIMLEEINFEYKVTKVNINKDEQFKPEFAKLSPFRKIPVIIDHENNQSLFESGAILIYLAEKSGRLIPKNEYLRFEVLQWVMFQMSAVGPMMGQAMFFQRIAAPKGIVGDYAIDRYVKESRRLLEIIDHRLSDREYICDAFSIADIAIFPWARAHRWGNIDVSDLVHLSHWFELMEAKDSVQKGIRVPSGKYPVAFSSVADLSEATRLNSEKYEA